MLTQALQFDLSIDRCPRAELHNQPTDMKVGMPDARTRQCLKVVIPIEMRQFAQAKF